MQLSETDRKNMSETLNLEWSATFRYKTQMQIFNNPHLVGLIDGIMRNEADHIDIASKYLLADFNTSVKGFRTALFYLYLNWEFEKFANATYAKFRKLSEDEQLKESFHELIKAEAGHSKIFREMIEKIEAGKFPVVIICPVCGWELDYGESPQEGTVVKCSKCKDDFKLVERDGDWQVERVS